MLANRRSKNAHPLFAEIDQLKKSREPVDLASLVARFQAIPADQRRDGALLRKLFSLTGTMALFFNDEAWRHSITVDELNALDEDGFNALMMIAAYQTPRRRGEAPVDDGLIHHAAQLIDEDPDFRSKITAKGFCAMSEHTRSAAHNVFSRSHGLDLLLDHPEMRTKLTSNFMNKRREFSDMPFVFILAREKNGLEVLHDPGIRQLISSKGLGAQIASCSALYILTKKEDGMELFKDEVLLDKIDTEALNLVNESDRSSVVSHFAQSKIGRDIMFQHPKFVKKIQAPAFNLNGRSEYSPLFLLLISDEGLPILAKYKHLRDLIDIECFNRACRVGEYAGMTPLYILLSTAEGREILLHDRHLRSMIEERDLWTKPAASDVSVAHLLAKPDCTNLLKLLSKEVQVEVARRVSEQVMQTGVVRQSSLGMFAPQPPQLTPVETVTEKTEKRCVIL